MKGPLRKTMTWLHTWSSILLGWLLFAIFLTGTLSYFRMEINHWMTPEAHVSVPSEHAIGIAAKRLVEVAPEAESWNITLPSERNNTLDLSWRNPGDTQRRRGPMEVLNPSTGEQIEVRETRGGDFLYRFHFELYHLPRGFSRTLVEIATMAMFIALISGIIMHRKIFSDFFMFRTKNRSLGWSDAHAVTAVLALPFHLMITFSGLILLASTLVFWGDDINRSANGGNQARGPAQVAAEPVERLPAPDLTRMLATAEHELGARVSFLLANKPMTREAEYIFFSSERDSLLGSRFGQTLTLDNDGNVREASGMFATNNQEINAVNAINGVLRTLHEARFADPLVRWLFFIAGVSGTLMVGTGSILWATKRAKRQTGQFGFELVHVLNIASISGLCIAVASYFWLNRLLPAELAVRQSWEINGFFMVWLLTLVHAAIYRHRHAWQAQLWLAGSLFVLLPALDQFTSPVGLWSALINGDWMRLSFDGMSLLIGAILLLCAGYLRQKMQKVRAQQAVKKRSSSTASGTQEVIAK
ncbi:PepSY-associated TM helix domain-containing protein [Marinomonas ostreistagni]|uniref:PepSY-associated TM helix domain-containing protein n=1 Tax=Marinomonas ostreistagni TaxID=359209 RepID=UPI0019525F6A|nr:PepSY-associated TM helix domain-containing protein [Marinomonas ostreistagni]MBM6550954.1 PepSY domain-containing protein [Marinomonas ostreistagni]